MSQVAAGAVPAFGRSYRAYALSLLTAVYVLNFVDRQIVVILQESIRVDLELMDWQLSRVWRTGATAAPSAASRSPCGAP
jgi:hypothetical protein